MKKFGLYLVVIGLLGILFFSISGKAAGEDLAKSEQYYRELEKQYVKDVKEYLSENGLENSGVMLTKVICDRHTREYTLSVHNKRIHYLTDEQKAKLLQDIIDMEFLEDGCSFSHVFPT